MAAKACRANVGTRAEPCSCGEPIAAGMLAACKAHATTMIPVEKAPAVYQRGGSYVVVTRHRGKQHKSFHHTLAEAREAKADRPGALGLRRRRDPGSTTTRVRGSPTVRAGRAADSTRTPAAPTPPRSRLTRSPTSGQWRCVTSPERTSTR